jgi:hypothetical protein
MRGAGAALNLKCDERESNDMLAASPIEDAEEYAIHDYEGFCGYYIAEYCSIETAHKIALFIEEHLALGAELLSYYGGDLDEAKMLASCQYRDFCAAPKTMFFLFGGFTTVTVKSRCIQAITTLKN